MVLIACGAGITTLAGPARSGRHPSPVQRRFPSVRAVCPVDAGDRPVFVAGLRQRRYQSLRRYDSSAGLSFAVGRRVWVVGPAAGPWVLFGLNTPGLVRGSGLTAGTAASAETRSRLADAAGYRPGSGLVDVFPRSWFPNPGSCCCSRHRCWRSM